MLFVLGVQAVPIPFQEYSDFQCPYCARFYADTYPLLKEKYFDTGLVKFEYKHFPLTTLHPHALKAAEASECARDQGKFTEYHNILFENQENLDIEALRQYAATIGLHTDPFNECLESGVKEAWVQAHYDEGYALGVRGTPTFFIGGNKISGAQPAERFIELIDKILTGDTPTIQATSVPTSTPTSVPEYKKVISFVKGWNLFSQPFKRGNIQAVITQNSCTPGKTYAYHNQLNQYNPSGKIEKGEWIVDASGLWFKAKEDCQITVEGDGIYKMAGMHMYKGWNLIAGPYETTRFQEMKGNCQVVKGPLYYDAMSRRWITSKILEPTKGYFVKTASECQLGEPEINIPFPE